MICITLLVVSLVIFLVTEILPGDVAVMMLKQSATPEGLARIRNELGLERPAHVRYLDWVGGVLRGDWGDSYVHKKPITDIMGRRLWHSAILAVFAFVIGVPTAVAAGIWAGVRPDTKVDRLVSMTSLVGISVPEFVTGVLLMLLLATTLHLLPPSSLILPGTSPFTRPQILILPTLTITAVVFAYVMRMTRANVIEVMQTDYVRTAILKGLPMRRVILRHVLQNAMLPTITIIATNFGWMLGGLIIVENVFAYPGIGQLVLWAINNRDIPLLEGGTACRRYLRFLQSGGRLELRGSRSAGEVSIMVTRTLAATGRRVRYALRLTLRTWAGRIALPIVLLHIMLAFIGPWLAPYSPTEFQRPLEMYQLAPPSSQFWFGTDQFARDVFSRVLCGATSIIGLSVASCALGITLGTVIGMSSGYKGGRVDEIVMRIVDGMYAFPTLLLALLVLSTLGSSNLNIILTIGIAFTPGPARVMRSTTLSLKTMEFVQNARLRGESTPYIIFREILPNVLPTLGVEATVRLSYAILTVASLGFLGMGVQPPSPDWGLTISESRPFLANAPWVALFPAAAVASLVVGVNLLTDGIRQASRMAREEEQHE